MVKHRIKKKESDSEDEGKRYKKWQILSQEKKLEAILTNPVEEQRSV